MQDEKVVEVPGVGIGNVEVPGVGIGNVEEAKSKVRQNKRRIKREGITKNKGRGQSKTKRLQVKRSRKLNRN